MIKDELYEKKAQGFHEPCAFKFWSETTPIALMPLQHLQRYVRYGSS